MPTRSAAMIRDAATAAGTGLPRAPRDLQATGLGLSFMVELLAKALFVRGQMRLPELVRHIKLPPSVLEPILAFMRGERLCEMVRQGETEGAMAFSLTDSGRSRAAEFMRRNGYAGPAPVSLQDYTEEVEAHSVADMGVTRETLQAAFKDIVAKPQLLERFGAAMNSGRAIFIYGPAGSGKTYLAERLLGLLSGEVAVPYAILVDNEVIQVFDPLVHVPVGAVRPGASALDLGTAGDARWLACRRPVVMTGAELTLPMVDLQFDRNAGFYQAPPQVKANNGLFILDDLGRQQVSAEGLMNRWIVPLDRRLDYLALHTGQKFRVPFDVIVVFSSNLPPSQLADQAFLRRLGYKIFVGVLDEEDYRRIFRQVCAEMAIRFDELHLDHLHRLHEQHGKPFLACIPRDLLEQVRDIARFNGEPPVITPPLLDWAWHNYFARD